MRELGDRGTTIDFLNSLGWALAYRGDYDRATAVVEEALGLSHELGYGSGMAWSRYLLGDIARLRGDVPGARARYGECIRLSIELEFDWCVAACLCGLALVIFPPARDARADPQHTVAEGRRATRLWGATQALIMVGNFPLFSINRSRMATALVHLSAALGEEAFAQALAEGQVMSQEQAVAYALEDAPNA